MRLEYEAIPPSLQGLQRWVLWRYIKRDGKPTKPPYSALTGGLASTTDPATWATFSAAAEKAAGSQYWNGIGFVFSDQDGLMGVDLDHCVDPATGTIAPWAAAIVQDMNTYTEFSPSGEGLHLLFYARLDTKGRKGNGVEFYQVGRYFTMTGRALQNGFAEPQPRQSEVERFVAQHFPEPAPSPPAPPNGHAESALVGPDWDVIDRLRKNPKYDALWRGDIQGYGSHSEADLALTGHLAFYTGQDVARVDQLFRQSGLFRDKWDEQHGAETYGEMTIATALAGKTEFYEWRHLPIVVREADPFVVQVVQVVGRKPFRAAPTKLAPEALSGLPGEIVTAIDPHTESHPAAVLVSLITGMGCLIGPRPYLYRDGSRQTANEFALMVGRSSVGRKGTATRRIEEVLKHLSDGNNTSQYDILTMRNMHGAEQESLYESIRLSGLGSGEAMVEALSEKESDRRRMVIEEEFARCLKVMRREGSTLSETLRNCFDGTVLSNRTKGKHYRAVGHHVSILGHITEEELKLELGDVSIFNGFANRFLLICCGRTKSLARGGGIPPLAPLIHRLQGVLNFSRNLGQVEFSDPVMEAWDEGGIYELLNEEQPGLLGALSARAAAHVTRLSLFWMCMDMEAEVQPAHMLAALAVWKFSQESARYLFGISTGDPAADRIEEALAEVFPAGLDRTQIRDLFNRNARPGVIPAALDLLQRLGRAVGRRIEAPHRPTEIWTLQSPTTYDIDDMDDKSPLVLARRLLT